MHGDAYILIFGEVTAQVEVFEVQRHEASVRGAYNAVEEALGSLDVGGLGGDIASVFDFVTPSSPVYAFWVGLLGAIGANDADIGWFFVFGDVLFVNEKQGVGAFGHV